MAVVSIGEYEFTSRSAQEFYGDDQLVHVWWQNNLWFCAAACFRAPKAMTWGDFLNGIVYPWAAGDPSWDASTVTGWKIDGRDIAPADTDTLEAIGVGHKGLLEFRAASSTSRETLTGAA